MNIYHIMNLGAGGRSNALCLMFAKGEMDEAIDYAVLTPGATGGMLRRRCTAECKFHVVERIIRRRVVELEHRRRMPNGSRSSSSSGSTSTSPARSPR